VGYFSWKCSKYNTYFQTEKKNQPEKLNLKNSYEKFIVKNSNLNIQTEIFKLKILQIENSSSRVFTTWKFADWTFSDWKVVTAV